MLLTTRARTTRCARCRCSVAIFPWAQRELMTSQFNFFEDIGGADQGVPHLPEGFRYRPELIGAGEEDALLAHVRELPFREFEFHGYKGKRRVVSFGWQYDFSARHLRKADDIPAYLHALRETAAA